MTESEKDESIDPTEPAKPGRWIAYTIVWAVSYVVVVYGMAMVYFTFGIFRVLIIYDFPLSLIGDYLTAALYVSAQSIAYHLIPLVPLLPFIAAVQQHKVQAFIDDKNKLHLLPPLRSLSPIAAILIALWLALFIYIELAPLPFQTIYDSYAQIPLAFIAAMVCAYITNIPLWLLRRNRT